jgi:hypothetical protein
MACDLLHDVQEGVILINMAHQFICYIEGFSYLAHHQMGLHVYQFV